MTDSKFSLCPRPSQLKDYVDGEVDPVMIKEIDTHLSYCATCEATVQDMESDTDFGFGFTFPMFEHYDAQKVPDGVLDSLREIDNPPNSTPSSDDAEASLVGQRLGRYEILDLIDAVAWARFTRLVISASIVSLP